LLVAGVCLLSAGFWGSRPLGIGALDRAGSAYAQDYSDKSLAPFVPTPQEVVERMLALAQMKKGDVIYDLGSGDGRIVITAAKKYGARGVGFEIDQGLLKKARESARSEKVDKLVEFRDQDAMTADLSGATVLTLYLLPESNLKLRPRIWGQMKPGSRVVSHDFDMGDWKPVKSEIIKDTSGWEHTLYLWHVGQTGAKEK
jgi:hypothetical protein